VSTKVCECECVRGTQRSVQLFSLLQSTKYKIHMSYVRVEALSEALSRRMPSHLSPVRVGCQGADLPAQVERHYQNGQGAQSVEVYHLPVADVELALRSWSDGSGG
jgi:hypothetical protein